MPLAFSAPSMNFDKIIDRTNTNCLKYDFAVERGYPQGIQPFWVADMDFQAPEGVIQELMASLATQIQTSATQTP